MSAPWPTSSIPDLFPPADRLFVELVVERAYTSPFSPQWIALERAALKDAYVDTGPVWCWDGRPQEVRENNTLIRARLVPIIEKAREQLGGDAVADQATASLARARDAIAGEAAARPLVGAHDLLLYQDACFYLLYDAHDVKLQAIIDGRLPISQQGALYNAFLAEHDRLLFLPGLRRQPPEHIFACFYQLRRAFHHVHTRIFGASAPAAALRVDVWHSIVTHDLRAYVNGLHDCMADVHTLVRGPSGTGKELVAEAIGLSSYTPWLLNEERFATPQEALFHGISLADKSLSLMSAELFGHERGAFTGATEARLGWLEMAPRGAVLFLDEIAEASLAVQIMLLRATQTRTFQRVGGREKRRMEARLICATNQDLEEMIAKGTFREDLYHRICADVINTPSLRAQLDDTPDDLPHLVRHLADRVSTPAGGEALAEKTMRWLASDVRPDYPWTGNVRQLKDAMLGVMVRGRGSLTGLATKPKARPEERDPFQGMRELQVKGDEVMGVYVTYAFQQLRSMNEVARRLGIHRTTVGKYLDVALLGRLDREGEV